MCLLLPEQFGPTPSSTTCSAVPKHFLGYFLRPMAHNKRPEPTIKWASSQISHPLDPPISDFSSLQGNIQFWYEAGPLSDNEDNQLDPDNPHVLLTMLIDEVIHEPDSIILKGNHSSIRISGSWLDFPYSPGMLVSLVSCPCCPLSSPPHNSISDNSNFLILNDDLLSVTSFCSALDCLNNPLLNNILPDISLSFSNRSIALGKISHRLIESSITKQKHNLPFLIAESKRIINDEPLLLYSCNISPREAMNELLKYFKGITHFLSKWSNISTELPLSSTLYGIKGTLDCSNDSGLIIEIKSGSYHSVSHRAQLLLYILLRTQNGIPFPSLKPYIYYIKSSEIVPIQTTHSELARLVQLRNKIAINKRITPCRCTEDKPCYRYNKIMKLPDWHFLKSQLNAIEEERIKETKQIKMIVIPDGNKLIYSERQRKNSEKQQMYSEQYGTECMNWTKIRKIYKNKKIVKLKEQIRMGEYITIRNTKQNIITRGIVGMSEQSYTEVLSREILPDERIFYVTIDDSGIFYKYMLWSLLNVAYPAYYGELTLQFEMPGQACDNDEPLAGDDASLCDFSVGSNDSLENAANYNYSLVGNTSSTDIKRPTIAFNHIEYSTPSEIYLSDKWSTQSQGFTLPETFQRDIQQLNDDQRSALFRILNSTSYSVVHGMPGTGKSTLIALLIKILARCGKKVLLICYTHLAIENIIKKLGTLPYYRTNRIVEGQTPEEYSRRVRSARLVLGTCFSFNDPVFLANHFDFTIIDEGSQMHFLLALIPVSLSGQFCIFGDHFQLSPLSKSSESSQGSIGLSLFEHLIDGCSTLKLQYRMGSKIMELANRLFYDGQLVCCSGKEGKVEFVNSSNVDLPEFIRELGESVILCYFNSTVENIKNMTNNLVSTIDRYQGSEAERVCVVFDPVVRCNVMESRQRLNVAITRAKSHLILFGDRSKMIEIDIFRELIELIETGVAS